MHELAVFKEREDNSWSCRAARGGGPRSYLVTFSLSE